MSKGAAVPPTLKRVVRRGLVELIEKGVRRALLVVVR